MVRLICRGVFAADYIAALDGVTKIRGGWVNHNFMQVLYQLCNCVTGFTYAFFVTYAILVVMNLVPGLSLRAPETSEISGIDLSELGESAYEFVGTDYDIPQRLSIPIEMDRLSVSGKDENEAKDEKEGKAE